MSTAFLAEIDRQISTFRHRDIVPSSELLDVLLDLRLFLLLEDAQKELDGSAAA